MSFDLNSEQRAFRDVMRSFVDERIAPHAAALRPRADLSPEELRGLRRDGSAVTERPRGLRRRRGRHGDPGDHGRRDRAGLRVDVGDDADLQARHAARHELRVRGTQAPVPAANRHRRDPGELLPLGGRRRVRRRGDALSRGSRRGRVRAQRLQVLDHQRRCVGHLHRVREDRPREAQPRDHVLPRRKGVGRQVPQARGQARPAGVAHRRGGVRRPARPRVAPDW